jgi:transposase
MQGIKEYHEKLFISFRLSERVPQDNFYRQLQENLDLSYLRELTKKYYGTEGQKSIDTEVFLSLCL